MKATDVNVLDYIRSFHGEHGYPPTMREIADALGLASASAVLHHLRRLEKQGRIERTPGSARSIRVLAEAS